MKNENNGWHQIYFTGAIATIIALTGILLDVIIGNITGGNLASLPQTAMERLGQFHDDLFLGLYNLDLLNAIVQLIMMLSFFALYAAHRLINKPWALLALIIFITGSILMVSNNVALPMMELSRKFATTPDEAQKALYAAAGEALLAQGAHGSPGIFLGFFIPNLANLLMSWVMLKGGVFTRVNAWLGIVGSILMMIYVILVNFVPGVNSMAIAFAMPGGLLLMAWMILFTIRLFKLSRQ